MQASDADTLSAKELVGFALRFVAGLVVLLAAVATLAHFYRKQLESLALGFVEHLGYGGMAVGTLLADGFHFPVPPQFYMLLAISSGASATKSLAAISCASLLGGYAGFKFAGKLSHVGWFAKRLEKPQRLTRRLLARFGYRAALVASVLPIAFSVLCYLAGLNRVSSRFFALLALCRIPRLLLFYYFINVAWKASGAETLGIS